ncbi:glucosaminidase domain-containing protein [[Clostridium] innocuum]|uniref:glucosaminidase domain-containing protein n=1 Tax=Clostridium innocuum TaxID=1522 RepID=UPI001C385B22|nr:glucosaminidase domain-containing protein [[Clostridium] innocuum]MBV3115681.1 glucosaminidase domain-containing protein [[Clostridium] innocuum]MCI3015201.1 glucosaminidase domain-containing protein [[Clostridium] innocuum]MCR0401147.1 glucosaminidase domain-containing protein [[Clostridium] innocuum]
MKLVLSASVMIITVFGAATEGIHAVSSSSESTDMEMVNLPNADELEALINTKSVEKAIAELPVMKTVEEKQKVEEKEEVRELSIEELIQNSCERYGVPYDLTLAIARLETGWFRSYAYVYKNNPGGLSVNEVPIAFGSIEEGVDAFVGNLSRNYFAVGLDSPELIGQKYCPVNPEWSAMVRELMMYE